MSKKFRRPEEIEVNNEPRVPVSSRVRVSIDKQLDKLAKQGKISKTKLIESVLEDYVEWVKR